MAFLISGLALGCGSGPSSVATPPPASGPVGIQPATQVVINTSGYFPDPLPIHVASGTPGPLVFSGSDKTLMSCTEPISAGCFTIASYTIDSAAFAKQIAGAGSGSNFVSVGNNNIYQDDAGNWQMATTVMLTNPGQTADPTWSVIAHASPTNTGSPVPTAWTVDTLLVGSLSMTQKANYDGKYFEDGGNLYLLYSKALTSSPLHDGVVAQLMTSATKAASTAPQTLIALRPRMVVLTLRTSLTSRPQPLSWWRQATSPS